MALVPRTPDASVKKKKMLAATIAATTNNEQRFSFHSGLNATWPRTRFELLMVS